MASPPFNPNEAVPADNSLASAYPAAERTYRDIMESWMLTEHGRSGHHTFPMLSTVDRDAITNWEVGSVVYDTTLDRFLIVESVGPIVWIDAVTLLQGSESVRGAWEQATVAEMAAYTASRVITPDLIPTAAAYGTLTDAAPIAVDWKSVSVGWQCTPTTNRTIDNPSNGVPNTYRTILLNPGSGGARTITFNTLFLGGVPIIDDLSSSIWYLLTLYCVSSTHFTVSARRVK